MKRGLIALALGALADMGRLSAPPMPEFKFAPAPVYQVRQHPSLRRGKSGVAAAKRAARKRKNKG
ncbi:hypothetical protein ACFPVS_09090 [Neisseria weixii]|uniref:hypothetical protein n=1 Tax=Neisseria weixii TaxID=1853276 RepID=UPI00360B2814